jgi:Mg2+ and Co2+ transporter CorA
MMCDAIVDQAVYRDGRRIPCGDLSQELESLRRDERGFVWIGLKDPTLAEFALVNQELKLHPLAVEDAIKGNQRPKLDVYDDTMSSRSSPGLAGSTAPTSTGSSVRSSRSGGR